MSSSLNIVGKIDERICSVLDEVCNTLFEMEIQFVIVGATARDIVLHYGHGAEIQRRTMDIDFGIQIPDWRVFSTVIARLAERGFARDKRRQHRLAGPSGIVIDIIPFDFSGNSTHIAWPSDRGKIMKVIGFRDACESAEWVQIKSEPDLFVPVATPSGMAILKLIAWRERPREVRRKDALDFLYLLKNYERIPAVLDSLYGRHLEILEKNDFDLTVSAAQLLGRHAREIARQETILELGEFSGSNASEPILDQFIVETCRNIETHHDRNRVLIQAFCEGFND